MEGMAEPGNARPYKRYVGERIKTYNPYYIVGSNPAPFRLFLKRQTEQVAPDQ